MLEKGNNHKAEAVREQLRKDLMVDEIPGEIIMPVEENQKLEWDDMSGKELQWCMVEAANCESISHSKEYDVCEVRCTTTVVCRPCEFVA